MPLALDDPPPAAFLSGGPWSDLLTRIAEDTEVGTSVRVAGELLPVPTRCRLVTVALADVLHARYFRSRTDSPAAPVPAPRHGGTDACARLVAGLRPRLLGRDGWSFRYRSEAGVPAFLVTSSGGPGADAASCFLDLTPGIAPEAFARLITTLDGFGLGFRAELRGDPATPERVGPAVVTVARSHADALARVVLHLRDRSPLVFGNSVAAFTRTLAPGIGLADEPADGTSFGRHRCRLLAAALVAAGPGAGPAERRAAILRGLADAGIDPAAPHLDPGNPEFRV